MVDETHSDIGAAANPTKQDTIVQKIVQLFEDHGEKMYGEAVTELTHALQCAEEATKRGASDALIVATLLHDIGHLLHNQGEDVAERGIDMRHEIIGEKFLRNSFPETVSRPVGLHVAAKRYLASTEEGYVESLSEASKRSLELQGGLMTSDEILTFESDPYHLDAVLLRRCDEAGKRVGHVSPPLETYLLKIRGLVENSN